jgi:hypothetical protein
MISYVVGGQSFSTRKRLAITSAETPNCRGCGWLDVPLIS